MTMKDEQPGRGDMASSAEFNFWCALNDLPFRLSLNEWPDGGREWDVEVLGAPGAEAATAYGTGQTDESDAIMLAQAFIAGVEWTGVEWTGGEWAFLDESATADENPAEGEAEAESGSEAGVGAGFRDGPPESRDEHPDQHRDEEQDDETGDRDAELGAASPDLDTNTAPEPAPDTDSPEPLEVPNPGAPLSADADEDEAVSYDIVSEWGGSLPPDDEIEDDDEIADGDPLDDERGRDEGVDDDGEFDADSGHGVVIHRPAPTPIPSPTPAPSPDGGADEWRAVEAGAAQGYARPDAALLQAPGGSDLPAVDEPTLARNARSLETVLSNFRVRGEIMDVRPGPVITLYEFEPRPGTKSSTIINLADDIARSMSAVTARIAVVPGRSVIGVELPNPVRETVYLAEIVGSDSYRHSKARLPLALGKDIGGQPVVMDLATMPHLLIAGTTGSGKSVGINTMILSLLFRHTPDQCRLIMIDPKMLELSIYDGIPHLLTPVVTDPKKAVVALRWAVREMESRYKMMSALGVRNIDTYNRKVADLKARGEMIHRQVQVGFDKESRQPIMEDHEVDPVELPFIVIVVDEMADLMLMAGKDIEAVIQRLAQMARAAGIHLIMATQRPSVDVITGTIKANFPTRISFQVTSKIDSRTILGEAGAEQLLGQGDMLSLAPGGRITRVHGAFVADAEVERIADYLRAQGEPDYMHTITEEDGEDVWESTAAGMDMGDGGDGSSGDDLFDRAVAVVRRENKVSVSFIQRHLQIGYNRAATLVEKMEADGLIGPANHVGKREILLNRADH
ncbi:DNA translocase FtsK [Fodinicurvata sp. EGI_FJ10296]|uniref:DNA translocase FtsK n=1 Tax=Fodinicurvata sp. EGI_FJ10296 TaxID=3231908 RepID=UPI003453B979